MAERNTFSSFIDKFCKCAQIYCIKSEDKNATCLIEYVNLVENLIGKKVRKLQRNNRKEYMNREVSNFIKYKELSFCLARPTYMSLTVLRSGIIGLR